MSKIIVRIAGGIGNQLFTYAAARRLALNNNMELVIDDVSGFLNDTKYNRSYQLDRFCIPCRKATSIERLEPFPRIRKLVMRHYNSRRTFAHRNFICQEGIAFDSRLLHMKLHNTLYLEGYWQSEDYFKDVEQIIRDDLYLSPPKDEENVAMADEMNDSASVAVHFRFYDDPNGSSIHNLPIEYYTDAFNKMEKMVSNAHYYIFSDRPTVVMQHQLFPPDRVTYVLHNDDKNAYKDLWLMSLCKHAIIANSTFSWWGAWLTDSAEKVVIAPGLKIDYGAAGWGFDGLIPNRWITTFKLNYNKNETK